ncbi:hypothetical protein ACFLQN_04355 [Candidatus Aenigmatarchaeota archaeon]
MPTYRDCLDCSALKALRDELGSPRYAAFNRTHALPPLIGGKDGKETRYRIHWDPSSRELGYTNVVIGNHDGVSSWEIREPDFPNPDLRRINVNTTEGRRNALGLIPKPFLDMHYHTEGTPENPTLSLVPSEGDFENERDMHDFTLYRVPIFRNMVRGIGKIGPDGSTPTLLYRQTRPIGDLDAVTAQIYRDVYERIAGDLGMIGSARRLVGKTLDPETITAWEEHLDPFTVAEVLNESGYFLADDYYIEEADECVSTWKKEDHPLFRCYQHQ